MSDTHLLVETGRASRVAACDEPFANGQPGSEHLADVTCQPCAVVAARRSGDTTFVVIADDHSNHGLPVGAHVEPIEAPEWYDPSEESHWYTQGAVDDEVSIDPRDLAVVASDETAA